MKNARFVALLLSLTLLLTLSALSQQASSNEAATPATASGNGPLPPQTPTDFWDGDQPGVAWLVLHPFASKDYVKRHTVPIKDRLQELDDLTASNSTQIHDVDARAQKGLQLASEKTSMGDEHAQDAANKAQMAQQAAAAASARISADEGKVGGLDSFKAANQTEILFRPGQTVLSKAAKDALDQIAGDLKNQHGYLIEVQGFASGHGQTAIANSRKMADSVLRYLVLNHDIPAYRIYVIGMGDASVDNGSVATGKHGSSSRVEVSLLKNGLDQTAQQ